MPPEKTSALVVRTIAFSNTSQVVTLFTRELGTLRALAKGSRRLRSPFEGALDLLAQCRIVSLSRSGDALDLLTEAELVRNFAGLRRSLPALYAATYVAELLADLAGERDPHARLWDATVELWQELSQVPFRPERLFRYEVLCLRELGVLPQWTRCAGCDGELPRARRYGFRAGDGGVFCEACVPSHPHVWHVGAGTLAALQWLAQHADGDAGDLDLGQTARRQLRRLLGECFSFLMGRKPKLLEYLTP